jgi:heme A synthase
VGQYPQKVLAMHHKLFEDIVPHNVHDWVQFAHRGMALVTFMWIMFTFIHAVKKSKAINKLTFVMTDNAPVTTCKITKINVAV